MYPVKICTKHNCLKRRLQESILFDLQACDITSHLELCKSCVSSRHMPFLSDTQLWKTKQVLERVILFVTPAIIAMFISILSHYCGILSTRVVM